MIYNGISAKERRQRALASLEAVEMVNRAKHRPSQLSGGQQQRIAIARALVNRPDLLLADEPTGNLDTRTSIEIMGLFQALNEAGITVVMVTHELDIAGYCNRIVVMRDGRLLEDRRNEQPLHASAELARLDQEEQHAQIGEDPGSP
jgi:putative ABC transport system ATP-binding protein